MKQAYHWDDWFAREPDEDGKVRFVLVKGEHYQCSQSSMSQQVRSAAKDRGYRVNVQDLDDRIAVAVRKPSVRPDGLIGLTLSPIIQTRD